MTKTSAKKAAAKVLIFLSIHLRDHLQNRNDKAQLEKQQIQMDLKFLIAWFAR